MEHKAQHGSERIKRLSQPPKHHFFGYYGISPWDETSRYHLALETDFHDRRPEATDSAAVGLIDTETGQFEKYAHTSAFNLQQGSMLHWIDVGFGRELTFNDHHAGKLVSRALNPQTGQMRTIDGAIAAVSPSQPIAMGLNYSRMALCRKVVGYAVADPDRPVADQPEDDGLFQLDLHAGGSKLVLPIAEVIAANPMEQTQAGRAWFNHVVFNTDGTRLMFFCRVKRGLDNWFTSLWTVDPDGSDLKCHIDYRYKISHFDWRDAKRLLVSTDLIDEMGFVEFTDDGGDFHTFGRGVLPQDAHATFSPNRNWIAYDGWISRADWVKELALYNIADDRKVSLGGFLAPEQFTGDIRCDLHPRWRPDGQAVTFDSIHEGSRQVYLADVSDIVSQ